MTSDIRNKWALSMIAACVSSTRSARHLIQKRQYWDAKLVARSVYTVMVDLLYVLCQPEQSELFERLFMIEYAVDKEKEMREYERRQKRRGCKLSRANEARRRQVDVLLTRAKKDPAFKARGKARPKRWMRISLQEKMKSLVQNASAQWHVLFEHNIVYLGNSAAHARFLMLDSAVRDPVDESPLGPNGRPSFSTRLRMPELQREEDMYYELFVCNAMVAVAVIDKYQLQGEIVEELDRLVAKWQKGKRHSKKRL